MDLVGRERELEAGRAALDAAAGARPAVLLVGGEAGVGKSALLDVLLEEAGERGMLALRGGCVDASAGAVPFLPVVEALSGLPRELGERAWARLVADAPPQLGWLLPGTAGAPADTAGDPLATASARVQVLELVLGLVRRLAAERPLVLAVEDVHWADASTRDLLAFLARALRDERVALAVTFRADEPDRGDGRRTWLAELGRDARAVRLDLRALTTDELGRHLAAVLGHEPDGALVADVHRRCGGNPFLAQELVRAGGELPGTLREVLLARLAALPAPALDAARWVAAAGGRLDHRVLAAVAGGDETVLGAALRGAVDGGVLVAEPSAGRWAYRHELLREAAYDDLLPGEREARHRALAEVLEGDPSLAGSADAAASAAAGHWMAAREPRPALRAAVRAAGSAERMRAYPEAHELLERALSLWDAVPDAAEQAAASREEIVTRAAETAALGNEVERALELTSGPEVAERLRPLRGWWLMLAGRADEALAAYEAAEGRLPPAGTPERAWTLALHALASMLAGRPARVDELARRAEQAAAQAGVPAAASLARTASATVRVQDGDPTALAELERALALAREAAAGEAEAIALTNLTHALGRAGRLEESVTLSLDGAERCRQLGIERGYGLFLVGNACEQLVLLGRFDEAQALVDHGLDLAPAGITAVHLHTEAGAIALERGDADAALAAFERAREVGMAAGDHFVADLEVLRADALARAGRPDDAAAAARAALDAAIDGDDIPAAVTAARSALAIAADRASAARARRDTAAEAAALADGDMIWAAVSELETVRSPGALAALATAEAERSRLAATPDPEAWERAAAAWRALPAPARAAAAEVRRAEALLQRRAGRAAVAEALVVAHRAALEVGAHGVRRDAERLAARARVALPRDGAGPPPPAPTVPPAAAELGVTPRELEVLGLVAAGRTNQQIADELVISVKTAGIHVSSLLRKLGVGNRGEAGAVAVRAGLVDGATLDRLLG